VSAISAARDPPVSYVIGLYVGGMLCDEITECPLSDGCGCDVVRHDRRRRKTGPWHLLVVLRCRVHAITFTSIRRNANLSLAGLSSGREQPSMPGLISRWWNLSQRRPFCRLRRRTSMGCREAPCFALWAG